jgi:hypothetical protein
MDIHKFTDYKMAQLVLRDFPSIILLMEHQKEQLKKYKHYLDVVGPINSINDSIESMKHKLVKYKKISEAKGRINGEK